MDFAYNLKQLLEYKDIEIKELAAGTGISKNTIDNYLSGQKSLPNAENAVKIAKFLDTTVEYLVTGELISDQRIKENKELLSDLSKLKYTDLDSIKKIIHSLATK